MTESAIHKIEIADIQVPIIESGATAIVLQRHEKYSRDTHSENLGSVLPDSAEQAFDADLAFFDELLDNEGAIPTMLFFVSSDTQYKNGGRRSLETAQIAQDAAKVALEKRGLDPKKRIINLNPDFKTDRSEVTDQDIRTVPGLREPRIFESPDYVEYLKSKHGRDGQGGLSQKAWAAHESDAEVTERERYGAEGVGDIITRTHKSINTLARYGSMFHANNPDSKLLIWADTHYDTISPFVKDVTGTDLTEYVPVDYGAGVVITVHPKSSEAILHAQQQEIILQLGSTSLKN